MACELEIDLTIKERINSVGMTTNSSVQANSYCRRCGIKGWLGWLNTEGEPRDIRDQALDWAKQEKLGRCMDENPELPEQPIIVSPCTIPSFTLN